MEFGWKRNHRPSCNFDSDEENLCYKKSKSSGSLGIKAHANESVARDDEKFTGWPGQSIFRIVVPRQMVRHLGCAFLLKALIKYEDIKTRIKFIVGPCDKRIVMVSAKEEPDSPLPPAVDGLLRVHRFFLDWLRDNCFPSIPEGKLVFVTSLLVPAVQVSSLIKSSMIKSIKQDSSCEIVIFGGGSPDLRDDLMVKVSGKFEGVHKAVELIGSNLREFVVDQSVIPSIEMQHYRIGKPPHHGISLYGRETSLLARASSNQSAQFISTEESHLCAEISRSYADAIIGIEGANITCIRRLTGAMIAVEEMQEVPDQIVVMIDGSRSQILNAERLMLMFIAEAGGPQSTDSLYKGYMSGTGSHIYCLP